jgi:miniconductance mechanosensitive channel
MFRDTLSYYIKWLQNLFVDQGMNPDLAIILNTVIVCILAGGILAVFDIILRKFIVQGFKIYSDKTKSTFDDYLIKSNFPRFIAHFVPLLIFWYLAPLIFSEYPILLKVVLATLNVYLVTLGVLVFRSFLRTTKSYLESKEQYRDKPLQSYMQVLMIFAWGLGIFLIINILTDFSIESITTLGAASALILLIFKDTILGFVASVQVSVNDIVRIGDWITFSKFGADGNVTEINLATVLVQNFDNTFTTIPTYSLIADSFQNWRGMQESEGRRIKRSLFIKHASIKFMSDSDLKGLEKIQLIAPYIAYQEKEIRSSNKMRVSDKSLLVNGRNQTNLGIFRNYAEAFLNENEHINKDLFLMVRHLAPTDKGIPIEIFCFSHEKEWVKYERIQANIFDHLIAAVPYFDLEIFELPSGSDLTKSGSKAPPVE